MRVDPQRTSDTLRSSGRGWGDEVVQPFRDIAPSEMPPRAFHEPVEIGGREEANCGLEFLRAVQEITVRFEGIQSFL